jgi:hypothetical protein
VDSNAFSEDYLRLVKGRRSVHSFIDLVRDKEGAPDQPPGPEPLTLNHAIVCRALGNFENDQKYA